MATLEQCRDAIDELGRRLARVDPDVRAEHVRDRTVSCTLLDLDEVFSGRLHDGHLVDITLEERPRAQIRLTLTSDDLVDMVEGRLPFVHAWATGRIRLDASVRDLLRLRALRR